MSDIDQLIASSIAKLNYEGNDAEIISCKAKEMLRLMNMKLPNGSLRKAEGVRPVLALDLSLRVLGYAYNKKILFAAISPKDYNEAITICKNILALSWDNVISIESLSIQFECENVSPLAHQIITKLKELGEVRCNNCIYTNFDTPLFCSVSFFLAARQLKINIRQKSVLDTAEVEERSFRDICDYLKNDIKILANIKDNCPAPTARNIATSRNAIAVASSVAPTPTKRSLVQEAAPQKNRSDMSKFIDDLKSINNTEAREGSNCLSSVRDIDAVRTTSHANHRRTLLERKETLYEEQVKQKKRDRDMYEQFAKEVADRHGLVSFVPIL